MWVKLTSNVFFFCFCFFKDIWHHRIWGATLRASGRVGVNSVYTVCACVGCLYGCLHPSVCDINGLNAASVW